jgi:tRNA pseudouridine55 synthase
MDGLLIIDKPAGLTSHDVVARVRRVLKIKRVGHTGTLDPFATGVLVLLIGRATRLAQFLSNAEKEYEAVIRFGYATDTGDLTGQRLETRGAQNISQGVVQTFGEREIEAALESLRGEIEQVPPMYSAKKVEGRKLYDLARRGVAVERQAVKVIIHELEALRLDGAMLKKNEDGTCDLSIRVVCSAGTYIRTLGEAIGERLGTPAHLAALRRTRAGSFRLKDGITLDELEERAEGAQAVLISTDEALRELPFVHLTADEARATVNGVALVLRDEAAWPEDQPVRMRNRDGQLVAIGFYDAARRVLRPRVVLFPENKN